MKRLFNKFLDLLADKIAEKVNRYISQHSLEDMAWEVFSTVGVDNMAKIVKEGTDNRKEVGHFDYRSLAKFQEAHLRKMAIERLREMLSRLTEVDAVSPVPVIKKSKKEDAK